MQPPLLAQDRARVGSPKNGPSARPAEPDRLAVMRRWWNSAVWPDSKPLGVTAGRLAVVSLEPLGSVLVDQLFIRQPLSGPDPCPGATEGVPGRDQLRVRLVELVLEAPERALARQRAAQALASAAVADAVAEVDYVLVPDVGREGVDHGQVQLVELDRVFTVAPRVAGPLQDLARCRLDQPSMLVVGLI